MRFSRWENGPYTDVLRNSTRAFPYGNTRHPGTVSRLKNENVRDHRAHVRKFASLFTWRNNVRVCLGILRHNDSGGARPTYRVECEFCNTQFDALRRQKTPGASRKRGWLRSSSRKRAGVESLRRRVPIARRQRRARCRACASCNQRARIYVCNKRQNCPLTSSPTIYSIRARSSTRLSPRVYRVSPARAAWIIRERESKNIINDDIIKSIISEILAIGFAQSEAMNLW